MKKFFTSNFTFYGLLLAAMLYKYFPFGLVYFTPIADDYCVYGVFNQRMTEGLWRLFVEYHLFSERPMAGLTDVFIITPLWHHLWVVLAGMTILHFVSLWLLDKIMSYCKLPWGHVAALVFGLYPLLAEASYWINAAVRIVPGFFFLTLSAWLLCRYLFIADNEKKTWVKRIYLLTSVAAGLLSVGFYEQTVTFGFALLLIIIWAGRSTLTGGKMILFALPFCYPAFIGIYYFLFIGGGSQAKRSVLSDRAWLPQLWYATKNIISLFTWEHRYNAAALIQIEFRRFVLQWQEYGLPIVVCAVLACLLTFALHYGHVTSIPAGKHPFGYAWACTLLLFIASFGPFFILQEVTLRPRNVFFCVTAIAMAIQMCWHLFADKKHLKMLMRIVVGFAIWICLLFNVAEVSAFRISYQTDQLIGHYMVEALAKNEPIGNSKVWVFGAQYQYAPHGANHVEPAVMSDWGLTGLITVLSGKREVRVDGGYFINPITAGREYTITTAPDDLLLAITDNDLRVHRVKWDNHVLYFADTGAIFGYLENNEGNLIFYPA